MGQTSVSPGATRPARLPPQSPAKGTGQPNGPPTHPQKLAGLGGIVFKRRTRPLPRSPSRVTHHIATDGRARLFVFYFFVSAYRLHDRLANVKRARAIEPLTLSV